MSLALVRFIALTVGPAIMAAARPALTFFAIQLLAAALVYQGITTLPEALGWLVSVPALVVAAVLAALETAAKHDPDTAALMRDLKIDNITGAFGAFSAALLFASLGLPEGEALELTVGAVDGGVLGATAIAATTDVGQPVQIAAVGGGLAINLGLTWLRSELLEFVDSFELGKVWARVETGGVLGVLIVLPLLPLLGLAFVIASAVLLAFVSFAARAGAAWLDDRKRVACDACGYRVREEASICPECRTAREPSGTHEIGFSAAVAALRREEAAPTTTGAE